MIGKVIYSTPVGGILAVEKDGYLTELSFQPGDSSGLELPKTCTDDSHILLRAGVQLFEYFSGKRRVFDLPLSMSGTNFLQRVWNALLQIPYGETRSYGEIASIIGAPGAARAVGMANNKNKIPIIIPCHRVIGADGRLVGYGGGLEIKKRLLCLEMDSLRGEV